MLGVVVIAVGVGLVWGVQRWNYGRHHVSTDDAQIEGRVVPVLSKVGGYVADVGVHDNERVNENQTLLRIDDADLADRMKVVEAELEAAGIRARVERPSLVEAARRRMAALEARVESAQADAQRAETDLTRLKSLADEQIVSPRQLDEAASALDAAHAAVTQLEQQIAAARADVSAAESAVRLAQSSLQSAKASRDMVATDLSHALITAPASGTVARSRVEPGQLLQPGQPLMAIVVDSSAWITANFKETDLGRLHAGQPVDIEVDAYPTCRAQGEIESMSAATGATFALLPPDNATGNFTKVVQRIPVRIRIVEDCGSDQPLRAGLSTTVHVQTAP